MNFNPKMTVKISVNLSERDGISQIWLQKYHFHFSEKRFKYCYMYATITDNIGETGASSASGHVRHMAIFSL